MRAALARTAVGLSFLAMATLAPTSAHAYCRETTLAPGDGCACADDGFPLYWEEEPIPYALNERGFPGITDEALRAVLARSFAHWTDVTCDDEPIVLSVTQLAETTPMAKEHVPGGPNLNVLAHLSTEEFRAAKGDPHAFAVTTNAIDTTTGEIVGADTIFNGGLGPFVICPDDGCPEDSVDIENVATHEIGHFFGLAHSPVADSTMECAAQKGELKMRSLEADDKAGICAIYGPVAIEERAEALHPRHAGAGCGCRAAPPSSSQHAEQFGWLGLASLFFLRRSRHS